MVSGDIMGVEQDLTNYSKIAQQAWESAKDIHVLEEIDSIAIFGLGEDILAGGLIKSYINIDMPVFLLKDLKLPAYIKNKTLVFVVSKSGEDEESVQIFREAMGRGCKVIAISCGGKIEGSCKGNQVQLIKIPKALSLTVPHTFFSMLRVLHNSKLIEDQEDFIKKTFEVLAMEIFRKKGEEIAGKLEGKIPLIYGSEKYAGVTACWKTQLNNIAKVNAFSNLFPEIGYSEIEGFSKAFTETYAVILQDESDFPQIKKAMQKAKEILAENNVQSTIIVVKGSFLLTKMLSAVYMGEFAAYFLALMGDFNPEAREYSDRMK